MPLKNIKQTKKIPVFIMILFISSFTYATLASEDKTTMIQNKPKHHTTNGFQNYPFVESASSKGIPFYLRRFWGSIFTPDVPAGHVLSKSEAIKLLNSVQKDSMTWLGHASFLIKVSGKTILTDPFLTEYASPVSWAGPRRFVDFAIDLDSLPAIDVVLVSHSHYDHLDDETIRALKDKDKIHVIVPLGLKAFFTQRGYTHVTELDWGESTSVDEIEFKALPAVHDSARSINDRDQTLWASWAINSPQNRILFIGDTGYADTIFKKIGKEYRSFDYAILPIGAYAPRELMWMSHITPKEAVTIGKEVHAKRLIASHWGTLSSLSDEPIWEPPKRFKKAGTDGGFAKESLWIMKIGETRSLLQHK